MVVQLFNEILEFDNIEHVVVFSFVCRLFAFPVVIFNFYFDFSKILINTYFIDFLIKKKFN